ncbi:nicotinamide riboside kinase 1 isoform X2 [Calonectris borealis]|uniref:nicotinamide riboside kinase 1 isoform X2 n=1 Tax=Calonectris borealis TaxID=1323832 RepID=UPI003F4B3A24
MEARGGGGAAAGSVKLRPRVGWRRRGPRTVGHTCGAARPVGCEAPRPGRVTGASSPAGAAPPGEKEELRRKQTMKVLVIGLGGVTNGGKTTLAEKLKKMLPNCDIISQDDFFKPESEVETDERGFKLYDVLDALYMDEMVKSIRNWMKSPASSGIVTEELQNTCDNLKNTEDVYILIVEGFLLYNYEPLNELWNRRYFLTLPYEECKKRRSTRVYQPADTPGYFDGHVWPMYLRYKNELEENASNVDNWRRTHENISFCLSQFIWMEQNPKRSFYPVCIVI